MTDMPPTDHGSDRYDYIEIDAPEGTPLPTWLNADWQPCQDCRANAFLQFPHPFSDPIHPQYDPSFVEQWHVTIAHDDGCPTLRKEQPDG